MTRIPTLLLISTLLIQWLLMPATYALDFFEDENIIWKSGYDSFVYSQIDVKKYGTNDHPVALEKQQIFNALQSMRIRKEGFFSNNEDAESLFAMETANRLAEYISKGLKQAKPDQDIYFTVQKRTKRLLVLTQKYITSGRMFYRDGSLNLIIGDYSKAINDALEMVLDPGQTGNSNTILGLDNAERTNRIFTDDMDVIKLRGVENKVVDNQVRKDWFVIDVDMAAEAYLADLKARQIMNKSDSEKQMELEAAKLAKQRREMRAEMARMRQQIDDIDKGGSSSAVDTRSIEQRMATLDALLAKDLITRDEYETKRQEILNDI